MIVVFHYLESMSIWVLYSIYKKLTHVINSCIIKQAGMYKLLARSPKSFLLLLHNMSVGWVIMS